MNTRNDPSFSWKINKPVFITSTALIIMLVVLAASFPYQVASALEHVQQQLIFNFSWFYILAVALFLIFCISIALSSYGQIKLGPDHIEPDFNRVTWFSMLFSAGMGIGLVFFGVAEPIMHYVLPPEGEPRTLAAAQQAMTITFFHWGLHAWAIYALVGLMLAYFAYRHNLPLSIRSSLYPLIGDRIYGGWGHLVDIAALLGTLFGIATSLGFGVVQINSGLNYLFETPVTIGTQFILIIVITLIAMVSATTGLHKGIRRLSELNLILVLLLLGFVLLLGPTVQLLQLFVQNVGDYLSSLVAKTFNLYAYQQTGWIGGWTLFYWGWWIAWSPFVGMFIARISRGRTIRSFLLGVLFVPAGFTFIWMTVFGNTAIYLDMQPQTDGLLSGDIQDQVETAIFILLQQLPLPVITCALTILIAAVFFITSCDSGALVMDRLTSKGQASGMHWQRIFWVSICGVIAAVLLYAGGLRALQTVALISALPFAIVILFAAYGLLRSLQLEKMKQVAFDSSPGFGMAATPVSWKRRLRHIVNYPDKQKVTQFLQEQGYSALTKVAEELNKRGLSTELKREVTTIALIVQHGAQHNEYVFYYGVHMQDYLIPRFALSNLDLDESDEEKYYRAEVHLTEGGQHYDIMGYSEEEIIADVLAQYDRHMQFLHFVTDKQL
ncbi:MAG: BCCT family transporter [Legionellales bacterium]|nr:BCCT family transporter [Legionellales bacterium]